MGARTWGFAGLAVGAGLALWLLFAGPGRILGVDPGNAGMVLLVGSAWTALYLASRTPRDADALSPGEWKAWLGVAFMLVAIVYFLVHAGAFLAGGPFDNPDAARVGRNLVLLGVAWAVVSSVVKSRWKGAIEADERDREIAAQAGRWGHGALVFVVVGVAVTLGLSPAERVAWATPFFVSNLLVFALMWGWLVEYAATALLYWRDRR